METAPAPATTILTIIGIASVLAALVLGATAVRRVLTLHDAAEELQVPIDQVRHWVNEGILENRSTDHAYIYLDPEQLRRFESFFSAEVAAEGPTAGG